MADYPVYKFVVKEDGTGTGMVGIALVDEPAVESSWEAFDKQEVKPVFIALQEEDGSYKQELLGVALRPDFPILRKDDNGNFYYGVFEKDTIETIRNKFHKEKKNLGTVNLQHDSEKRIDGYLIESYIIQSEEQLQAVQALGVDTENSEVGDWVVRYKIEDSEVFEFAKDNLTGFSIEILLERELLDEFQKNNLNKNKSIMSKVEKLVERFKTAITEFEEKPAEETPEVTETEELEDVVVAESGRVLRYTEVGAPVLEVTTDEEGAETTIPFEEAAELILEDGRIVVIDDDGNLVEIKDAEEEVEPVAEEDMEDEEKSETPKEELAEETEDTPEENLEDEEPAAESDLDKSLRTLIPTDSAGTYQVEVFVDDSGAISYGTMYAWTYKDLKLEAVAEEYENLKKEKEDLNTKVEELQAEMEKPVATPVFTQFKSEDNKSKEDFSNNLDYTLHRLGLDKE